MCFKKGEEKTSVCDNRKFTARVWQLLMAIALLSSAVPSCAADDWIYIGGNNGGDFYLNRGSIEKQRDYITGWVRWDLSDAYKSSSEMQRLLRLTGYEPAIVMALYGAQKGSRQIRQFQAAMYDKNGNRALTISAQDIEQMGSGQWQYCTPGTMEELIWEALMKAARIRY